MRGYIAVVMTLGAQKAIAACDRLVSSAGYTLRHPDRASVDVWRSNGEHIVEGDERVVAQLCGIEPVSVDSEAALDEEPEAFLRAQERHDWRDFAVDLIADYAGASVHEIVRTALGREISQVVPENPVPE
jgi:hypothetical protein